MRMRMVNLAMVGHPYIMDIICEHLSSVHGAPLNLLEFCRPEPLLIVHMLIHNF